MWYPYTWTLMDAIPRRLLLVCYPFLMFDVETMFLFPWAVVMRSFGPAGLLSVLFFLFILVLGLAYAWRKGALKWQ